MNNSLDYMTINMDMKNKFVKVYSDLKDEKDKPVYEW